MDSDSLPDRLIDDGERLIERLAQDGFPIDYAYWSPREDSGRWLLHIATPEVDRRGILACYETVVNTVRAFVNLALDSSNVTLVRPTSQGVLRRDYVSRFASELGEMHTGPVGPFRPEGWYIYPPAILQQGHTDLSTEHKRLLQELYQQTPLAVDDLPYTDDMDRVHRDFNARSGLTLTVRDVYKAIKNLGRQGRLGGKKRTAQPAT